MPARRVDPRRIKLHRLYTVDDVVRALDVHPNTVRNWIGQGLPAFISSIALGIRRASSNEYLGNVQLAPRTPRVAVFVFTAALAVDFRFLATAINSPLLLFFDWLWSQCTSADQLPESNGMV